MAEPEDTQEYLRRAAEEREQARAEAARSEAQKSGIVGDADAPLGYMVDPNHRPDPAHMGSVDTSGTSYRSEYDLKAHTGIFDGGQTIAERAVATGHTPVEELPVSEDLHPTIAAYERGDFAIEPGSNNDIVRNDGVFTPPPMGATDYSADPKNVGTEDGSPVLPANVVEVRGDPANADVITRGQEPEGYVAPGGDEETQEAEEEPGADGEPAGALPAEGETTEGAGAADPNVTEARIPRDMAASGEGAYLGNQPVVPPASGTTLYGPPPVSGSSESGYTIAQEQEGNEMRPTPEAVGEESQPEPQTAEGNADEAASGQPQGEVRTVTQADAGGATSV